MQTALSSKGQVVIPASVRKTLRLAPSARFEVEVRDGAIILTPIAVPSWRDLMGSLAGSGILQDFEADKAAEREREEARLGE